MPLSIGQAAAVPFLQPGEWPEWLFLFLSHCAVVCSCLWGCRQLAVIGGRRRRITRRRARRMREMSEEFMAKITAAGDWWRAHEFPPVQEQGGTHKKKNWRLRLCSNPGYEMKQRIVASWLELLMMIDKRRHALGLSLGNKRSAIMYVVLVSSRRVPALSRVCLVLLPRSSVCILPARIPTSLWLACCSRRVKGR